MLVPGWAGGCLSGRACPAGAVAAAINMQHLTITQLVLMLSSARWSLSHCQVQQQELLLMHSLFPSKRGQVGLQPCPAP